VVVGVVRAFPRHPGAGTPVEVFEGGAFSAQETTELYALVAVTWATSVTDAHTGVTKYVNGLGTPSGTTWHLRPVRTTDAGGFELVDGVARGHRDARLPAGLPGAPDAPAVIPVHDFVLFPK